MVASFALLSASRRDQVMVAVRAVESASRPLPAALFPALAEASLRHVVEDVLAASGRVLISSASGYISGYDDDTAQRLADEGLGVLSDIDRAVLAFIMIFSVAIPRAEGEFPPDAPWTAGRPVPPDTLFKDSLLQNVNTAPAIRRLRDASLIHRVPGKGFVLGDQFHRLTKRACTLLFEELILLAEPGGSLAESITRHREAATSVESSPGGNP
jgi:hypothetical protein